MALLLFYIALFSS